MHFATAYDLHDHDRPQLFCRDKTRTQQQFKDQCNINVLFARYLETGEIPQVMAGLNYGNFEGIFDFQSAMNAVRTAEGLFGQLPARIKNRFDNDPQKLLEFLADPDNKEEAQFLKLIDKEPVNNEPGREEAAAGTTEKPAGSAGTERTAGSTETTEKP